MTVVWGDYIFYTNIVVYNWDSVNTHCIIYSYYGWTKRILNGFPVAVICAMHGGVTNSDRWTGTIGVSWVLKQLDCMEEVYDDTEDVSIHIKE